jgi:hypothetical protein
MTAALRIEEVIKEPSISPWKWPDEAYTLPAISTRKAAF